jgi:hypothetical protein
MRSHREGDITDGQQIIEHAPQTIRLATGLNTHPTFTLPTLISALRHLTCENTEFRCARPATCIDMANLTHLCGSCARNGIPDHILVRTSFMRATIEILLAVNTTADCDIDGPVAASRAARDTFKVRDQRKGEVCGGQCSGRHCWEYEGLRAIA